MPYHAVVGADEAGDDQVALRLRDGRRLAPLPAVEVVARVAALTGAHSLALWDTDVPVPAAGR